MNEYILRTENLCKYFGNQTAVDNISIHITPNTIYGLLGPNGAGKSTTLKMLTGILRKDNGKIFFNGSNFKREHLENIGALIEYPAIYGNLTAIENLMVHIKLMGLKKEEANRVLNIVNLNNTGTKPTSQFSLGMKQRLGMAIALLGNPSLLILDEPTNGLDPVAITELRELIRSFPSKGITVILSSHVLTEVAQIVDHIGIITNGQLKYEGTLSINENLEDLFMKIVKEN